jgi:large subunit ribosomal protein LP1
LILYDDGQDITGDKLGKLVTASGVKIESFWPKLFAKAIEGKDISSFFNFGSASSGPAATVSAASVTAPVVEAKKAEDKGGKKK